MNYEQEYGENVSVNNRLIDLGYLEFPPEELDQTEATAWWFDELNAIQDARDREEQMWAEQQRLQEEETHDD